MKDGATSKVIVSTGRRSTDQEVVAGRGLRLLAVEVSTSRGHVAQVGGAAARQVGAHVGGVDFLRDIGTAQASVENRALTVAGTRHGGQWASITLPVAECAFPKTFAELLAGPYPSSGQSASFNPHTLRTLVKIAKRLGADDGNLHLHLGLSEPGKPMCVHIGPYARIVAMPSRLQDAPPPPPVFNPFPKEAA
jgi:hypothetical protein